MNNEKGIVLVMSILILALLTALSIGVVYMANTEVQIAGNIKTASVSLYVAEGGLEAVKSALNSSAVDKFAKNGTSNDTVDGFKYSSTCSGDINVPCTTVTYPLNWVNTSWYEYNGGACTTTVVDGNSNWPVCKSITVGTETALVIVQSPIWSSSAPTKVVFKSITSEHTSSAPNKKVEANFKVDFGNNFLTFQVFRGTKAGVAQVNNLSANPFLSTSVGDDFGLGGGTSNLNTDRITGIYTGNKKIRIDYCNQANLVDCTGTWTNLGIAEKNQSNNTFLLLSGAAISGPGLQCLYGAVAPLCSDPAVYPLFSLTGDYDSYFFRAVEIVPSDTCTVACT